MIGARGSQLMSPAPDNNPRDEMTTAPDQGYHPQVQGYGHPGSR